MLYTTNDCVVKSQLSQVSRCHVENDIKKASKQKNQNITTTTMCQTYQTCRTCRTCLQTFDGSNGLFRHLRDCPEHARTPYGTFDSSAAMKFQDQKTKTQKHDKESTLTTQFTESEIRTCVIRTRLTRFYKKFDNTLRQQCIGDEQVYLNDLYYEPEYASFTRFIWNHQVKERQKLHEKYRQLIAMLVITPQKQRLTQLVRRPEFVKIAKTMPDTSKELLFGI